MTATIDVPLSPSPPPAPPSHGAAVLDYTLLLSPSTRPEFVSQLRSTLIGSPTSDPSTPADGLGFFYLSNPPLPLRLWDELFDVSKRFFDLPLDERMKIDIEKSRHFRGYSKFADERTLGKVDHRDQIDFGPDVDPLPSTSSHLATYPFLHLLGPNQHPSPDVLPSHRELVSDWFRRCTDLAAELTTALEEALGAESGVLSKMLEGELVEGRRTRYGRMKTIRYPSAETVDSIRRDSTSTQGVGAHKDGGWLTLLATDDVPGLQVQDFRGRWIDVPPKEHHLVVNMGQQVEFVSRGIFQAATHRVVVKEGADRERFSIAYFATPSLTSRLRPLPSSSLSPSVLRLSRSVYEARGGADGIVSDVPKGDLHATKALRAKSAKERGEESVAKESREREEEEEVDYFGWAAWKGLTRSHQNVVQRWHSDLDAQG